MQQLLLSQQQFNLTINRLCYELIENHHNFENTAIVGIQPRGSMLASLLFERIKNIKPNSELEFGTLDITFHRDDIHHQQQPILPSVTQMNFNIEDKKVILVDDVLYTGRTIRAAMDAILSYGRPSKIELLVLIDRLYSRHLPIKAYYTGKNVDTLSSEKVKVEWNEVNNTAQVWLTSNTTVKIEE